MMVRYFFCASSVFLLLAVSGGMQASAQSCLAVRPGLTQAEVSGMMSFAGEGEPVEVNGRRWMQYQNWAWNGDSVVVARFLFRHDTLVALSLTIADDDPSEKVYRQLRKVCREGRARLPDSVVLEALKGIMNIGAEGVDVRRMRMYGRDVVMMVRREQEGYTLYQVDESLVRLRRQGVTDADE